MSEELIGKLRADETHYRTGGIPGTANLMREAADALAAKEKRIERLEKALEKIKQYCSTSSHPHCLTAFQTARAALEKPDIDPQLKAVLWSGRNPP